MKLLPLLFVVYWISVLGWSLLVARLCHGLRTRHPILYDAIGRPSLLPANGWRGELGLLRFLLARRYRFLQDPGLVRLCGTMRCLLVGYAAFFLTVPLMALG
ncbi:MAG TPA: hypothetical protein VF121_19365 [Thermoanaerobaculia bacterium]|nr:hypothetical protein [Thermoanaerobaculia bacterium]